MRFKDDIDSGNTIRSRYDNRKLVIVTRARSFDRHDANFSKTNSRAIEKKKARKTKYRKRISSSIRSTEYKVSRKKKKLFFYNEYANELFEKLSTNIVYNFSRLLI